MSILSENLKVALEADSLLDRAYMFLEDGDRKKAAEYFEKVLDANARSPFAYIGRMVIALNMEDMLDMYAFESSYTEHPDFVKALRFSEGALHDELVRISTERDGMEERYNKALAAERAATSIDELKAAYRLFDEVGDYADTEDRKSAIAEAVSVIKFYSERGAKGVSGYANMVADKKVKLEAAAEQFVATINMGKIAGAELKNTLNEKVTEHNSLGFFKGKRRKQLAAEVEEGKLQLAEMDKNLKGLRKKLSEINAELEKCESVAPIVELFSTVKIDTSDKNVNGAPDPEEEIPLLDYVDDKTPLQLLKNVDVLAVVAKDPCALYQILNEEAARKVALANKKSVDAVGSSPAFGRVAELCYLDIVTKITELVPYIPSDVRLSDLRSSLKKGATVHLGSWKLEGRGEFSVEWRVVDCRGEDEFFLVATEPVEWNSFNRWNHTEQSWDNCDLRRYMNGEMMKKMFTPDERKLVISTANIVDHTRSDDHLFIPSYDEIVRSKIGKKGEGAWLRERVRHTVGSPIPVDYWHVRVYDLANEHAENHATDSNRPIVPAMWIKVKMKTKRSKKA